MAADTKQAGEYHFCPHLGLREDAGTALAYPSNLNCCHHCKPVVPVNFTHQSDFCLDKEHVKCVVYQRQPGSALLAGLRGETRPILHRSWLLGAGSLVVLVIFLLVLWQLTPGGFLNPTGNLFQPEPSRTFMQVQSNTPPASSTAETGVLLKTNTPVPTFTPTRRMAGGLEMLLGYQNSFLIHRVRDGESLELLARLFGTAINSITAVNYGLPSPLPVGWNLVVPVNRVDVTGIPPLEAYQVSRDTLVNDLASALKVDAGDLAKYNNLDGNVLLFQGEWILVPRP